jgi:hypothetical protein
VKTPGDAIVEDFRTRPLVVQPFETFTDPCKSGESRTVDSGLRLLVGSPCTSEKALRPSGGARFEGDTMNDVLLSAGAASNSLPGPSRRSKYELSRFGGKATRTSGVVGVLSDEVLSGDGLLMGFQLG